MTVITDVTQGERRRGVQLRDVTTLGPTIVFGLRKRFHCDAFQLSTENLSENKVVVVVFGRNLFLEIKQFIPVQNILTVFDKMSSRSRRFYSRCVCFRAGWVAG